MIRGWKPGVFHTRLDCRGGLHILLYNGYQGSFMGVMATRPGFDNPLPSSSTEFNDEYKYTCTPPLPVPTWHITWRPLPLSRLATKPFALAGQLHRVRRVKWSWGSAFTASQCVCPSSLNPITLLKQIHFRDNYALNSVSTWQKRNTQHKTRAIWSILMVVHVQSHYWNFGSPLSAFHLKK